MARKNIIAPNCSVLVFNVFVSRVSVGSFIFQICMICPFLDVWIRPPKGNEIIISAFSKKLDTAQWNYSVTGKEWLVIVKGIENYRHYLLGKTFTLKTEDLV